ncbi:tetratricopeptide repeat-containing sulfotransferase family protein [Colwellia sp. C1TZA3]|uniref:tetratricopeptide repeat-containing sulfotransferase family protein n=1 Tax=Colwellia sp. C1TZA3 TaxID=2508879 RepID=UPI0011B9FE68|nr:tetratricopeptide repeat-containing sulfotransferase family protein [Colwellia sp. C1TZA3]TWX69998.1 tetratricopeptide repeat protein [Colwellia sp. C1TZA3]
MPNQLKNLQPDQVIKQCQLLIKKGHLSQASANLKDMLVENLGHIEGIYCLAVCQRKQQKHNQAMASLDQILVKQPDHGRAHQEQGYIHKAMANTSQAIASFEKAVALNPALFGSWRVLADQPDYPMRQEAKKRVDWLSSLPPALVSVSSLIYQKQLHRAEWLCRHFLKDNPHQPEAMRLLAELGTKFQILDDAEFLLASCLEFEPNYKRARLDYVHVLHKRQKFHKALEQAKILLDSDPTNSNFKIGLGNAQQATGDFEAAVSTFESVLHNNLDNYSIYLTLGHALKTMGRVEDAINAYRKSYDLRPDFGDAFWSLANLKTYRFTADERQQMRDQEASATTAINDKIHFCFALGKDLEDSKHFDEAFSFYHRGNKLKSEQDQFDSKSLELSFEFQKNNFDAAFFKRNKQAGYSAPDPIFIVGLPRAGSTLLEQILSSHSQVDGTMELANIIGLAHRLNGRKATQDKPKYPSILEDISADELTKMGKRYIEDTQHHRQGAVFFIDKMPNNFRHIALIHLILPNAKIIDARRDALSCCFSGYKQLFGEGQQFSYDLEDIGNYYRNYVEIMDHWDKALPGKILRVQYEDVVADLDTQVRRILDYCGLPFEQACIDFHTNKRAVRTPSSEQVRQPIYQSGLEQWRNYESHLGPLKKALSKTK